MRKMLVWVFLTLILSSCGGVSEQTKETMKNSLGNRLPELYRAEGITIYKLKPEILKVSEGDNPYQAKYRATFSVDFENLSNGDKVHISGDAGFDKDGFIVNYTDPYHEGMAYHIYAVLVNGNLDDNSMYNLTREKK